ncbi:GGDEF domain-containing protein [Alteromonadaceae bacterium BrNp21-10]|nr:GGDEF domain-containing protein [Alteromonadaceae bacterium BrNp21-10]
MVYLFYLVVSQGIVYLTFSSVMLLIWRKMEGHFHHLVWSIGFLFGAMGWLINLVPVTLFASPDIHWLVDNFITLISVSAVSYGFVLRAQRAMHLIWFVVATFVSLNILIYFSAVTGAQEIKSSISPLFVALCLQLNCYILWRKEGKLTFAEVVAIGICQMGALAHILRAGVILVHAQNNDPEFLKYYDQISYMFLPFIYTGIGIAILSLTISDLHERMTNLAITDQLTGALNLTGIEKISTKVIGHCQRSNQWMSLILAKIDNYQSIHEQYGSHATDLILKSFAETLDSKLDDCDYIGRTGSDEFMLLLPDNANADHIAEEMRLAVGQSCIIDHEQELRFTASFAVVSSQHDYCYNVLRARAELLLYKATLDGRNQVITESQDYGY